MQTGSVRRQLSLYVPEPAAAPIEAVRRVLDPVQHALIPAHVTLCRDDEAATLVMPAVARELAGADVQPITLVFGRAIVFDGHGVLLPCTSGEGEFSWLRKRVLGVVPIHKPVPHITLAHPRNPRSPGNDLDHALSLAPAITVTFPAINLIEQIDGGAWRVLDQFDLTR